MSDPAAVHAEDALFAARVDAVRSRALTLAKSGSDTISFVYLGTMAAMVLVSLYLLSVHKPYASVAAFLLLGLFQYYCTIAIHEAYHQGLLTNHRANELLGTVLAALVTFDFRAMKRAHLRHHATYGGPDDPDRPMYDIVGKFSNVPSFLCHLVAAPVLGLRESMRNLWMRRDRAETADYRGNLPTIGACQLCIAIVLYPFAGILAYPIYWVMPLVLIAGPLLRARTICEHAGLIERFEFGKDRQLRFARTHASSGSCWFLLQRVILSPFNFNFHHEHHSLPTVPYYQLPRLHAALRNIGYYSRYPENLSGSYFRTIRQEVIEPSRLSREPRPSG